MNNDTLRRLKVGGLFNFFQLLVLLCIGAFILILYTNSVTSLLRSNIAWVNLNMHLRDEVPFTDYLRHGADLFSHAVSTNARNKSAWFGLGMSYALKADADQAITTWSKSEIDPSLLIGYGLSARGKGKLDTALILFRAADALDNIDIAEGLFLAGTICQRNYTNQLLLSISNVQYCSDYLANNENNLIVNGDFSVRTLYGWEGEHFFVGKNPARLQVEELGEPGNLVVSLTGQDESNHFGLYQPLALAPGSTVRFSGRFKLAGEENLNARLLYISWQTEDGTPHGNHGEERSRQMEWAEFERTFRAPENIKSTINFYPVNFSGEGTIWFDDIKLELIPD